jgi:hypothetical protein
MIKGHRRILGCEGRSDGVVLTHYISGSESLGVAHTEALARSIRRRTAICHYSLLAQRRCGLGSLVLPVKALPRRLRDVPLRWTDGTVRQDRL